MYKLPSIFELNDPIISYIYTKVPIDRHDAKMHFTFPQDEQKRSIKHALTESHKLVQTGFYDSTLNNYKEMLDKITTDKVALGTYLIIASTIIRFNNDNVEKYSPIELIFNIKQCHNDLYPNLSSANAMHIGVDDKDIQLVMGQAHCNYVTALKALILNNGDIVNAIMELTM